MQDAEQISQHFSRRAQSTSAWACFANHHMHSTCSDASASCSMPVISALDSHNTDKYALIAQHCSSAAIIAP
jgi:hypothetical protein